MLKQLIFYIDSYIVLTPFISIFKCPGNEEINMQVISYVG